MMLIFYSIFSVGLYLWTTKSMICPEVKPVLDYRMEILVLGVALMLIYVIHGKEMRKQIMPGLIAVAALINIGMSVNYRCNVVFLLKYKTTRMSYLNDLFLMLFIFAVVYMFIRYTKIHRFTVINMFLGALSVVSVFGARLSGRVTGGSYLYFMGVMIFGIVLSCFPFVTAWFLSSKENRYLKGRVGNISWNLIGYLGYMLVLYMGCAACNEFGLLLVLGLTSSVMFLIRCKDLKSKIFYVAACASGAVLAAFRVSHISDRIQIWLNPVDAFQAERLKGKAESVLYLFRHIRSAGWWGCGIGNLSEKIYPTFNTDHVLVTLINDYSVFLAIAVIILGVVLVKWMLSNPGGLCQYDEYLNLSCALVTCFIILIDIASCLGSFITAGIGFPFVSEGSTVNTMLAVFVAIHCGLAGKGNKS